MSFIAIGLLLFGLSYWMKRRYQRKHNDSGIEGMNAILIAATILIIFYGIINRLTIL